MNRRAVLIVVDAESKTDQWASDLVGSLLGRVGLDTHILKMHTGGLAEGSTQRIMWNQLPTSRLLVTRLSSAVLNTWFKSEGLSVNALDIADPMATSLDNHDRVAVLDDATDAKHASAQVLHWCQPTTPKRGGVADDRLDNWIEQLDADPNL